MKIEVLKAKLHRAAVTDANLEYEGSITIDRALLEAARMHPFEKVDVLNVTNGARLSTYIIPGGAGEICMNGAAARLCAKGDKVIIVTYTWIEESDADGWKPAVILLDGKNRPKQPDN